MYHPVERAAKILRSGNEKPGTIGCIMNICKNTKSLKDCLW